MRGEGKEKNRETGSLVPPYEWWVFFNKTERTWVLLPISSLRQHLHFPDPGGITANPVVLADTQLFHGKSFIRIRYGCSRNIFPRCVFWGEGSALLRLPKRVCPSPNNRIITVSQPWLYSFVMYNLLDTHLHGWHNAQCIHVVMNTSPEVKLEESLLPEIQWKCLGPVLHLTELPPLNFCG